MLILKDYNETKLHSRSLLTSIHCYNYVTTVSNKPICYIFKDEPNFYRPRRILRPSPVGGVCRGVFRVFCTLQYRLYSVQYSIISIRLFPDFRPENSSLQGCVLSRPIQTLYVQAGDVKISFIRHINADKNRYLHLKITDFVKKNVKFLV